MSTPLLNPSSSVPTSEVRIIISSPSSEIHKADVLNYSDSHENDTEKNNDCESATDKVQSEQQQSDCGTPGQQIPTSSSSSSSLSPWTRRNSVSLPAGLNAIMSEPPEYEPQVC